MVITRHLNKRLLTDSAQFPVITVIGPRQSGKTTLVKQAFPNHHYLNLEAPDIRQTVMSDPRAFLTRYSQGIIFDEVQRVPELLSYIQVAVDEQPKMGHYILTGSHQLSLHTAISQSLAGRTSLLTLLPLTLSELSSTIAYDDLDTVITQGFYPKVYHPSMDFTNYYRNYIQTYLERDVRQLCQIKDLNLFQKFIQLLAGHVGQLLNKAHLSQALGISIQTIGHWLSILEASFIIVLLQPYYANLGKRLIKSPKLYFVDVGVACYLLGLRDSERLFHDPARGHLYENLAIMELIKARYNIGASHDLHFYRDNQKLEIDALLRSGRQIKAIEVKASQTFNHDFLNNLKAFREIAQDKVSDCYLVYNGPMHETVQDCSLIAFEELENIAQEL